MYLREKCKRHFSLSKPCFDKEIAKQFPDTSLQRGSRKLFCEIVFKSANILPMRNSVITLFRQRTFVIRIPIGVGYVNMGDSIVLLGGLLLGPFWGAVAGGVGSCLSDVVNGYAIYAPATLVIKALVAFCVAKLFRAFKNKKNKLWLIVSGAVSETIMVLGYFLFEVCLYGINTAAVGILPNTGQAVFGVAASVVAFLLLAKNPRVQKRFLKTHTKS